MGGGDGKDEGRGYCQSQKIWLCFALAGLQPWRTNAWYLATLIVISDSLFAVLEYFPPSGKTGFSRVK